MGLYIKYALAPSVDTCPSRIFLCLDNIYPYKYNKHIPVYV